jgi:NitT/TauT family transport system permease protein
VVSIGAFGLLVAGLAVGSWVLFHLLRLVPLARWMATAGAASLTLGRVLLSTALGTVWALPAGLAIGLSPRLSRLLQPVVQVAASFPAPMLFPIVIAALAAARVPLGWGSIVLMLLGTQWYILFNVIAGAMSIPADLKEAARSYRFTARLRLWRLYIPAVFPHLVTGWVTAAGGAWNASIVSEFVNFRGRVLVTQGVGSAISRAAERADFPGLAAGVVVMSTLVVFFNRTVWRRCYLLAEERYSLNR